MHSKLGHRAALLLGTLLACEGATAAVVQAGFDWQGDLGYRATSSFRYDDSQLTLGLVKACGQASCPGGAFNAGLLDLDVAFFDPLGDLLAAYQPVVAGSVLYPWLEFEFDPQTLALTGAFDIGRDAEPGDIYIFGQVGSRATLHLVQEVEETYAVLDTNDGSFETYPAPAPAPALLLGAGLLALSAGRRRRGRSPR